MRKILFLIFILTTFISGCARSNQAPAPVATDSAPANKSIPALALPTETPTQIPQVQITAVTQSAPTSESPPPLSPNDECDNPFYPVVNGAAWEYAISTGTQATHTMAISEDKVFTLTVKGDDSTFTLKGQCTKDGIILMDVPGVSSTYSDSERRGSTLTTQNVQGVILPNDVQAGDDWTQIISITGASSDGEVTLSATIKTSYTALGYEQVTVPAGTFYALKVEQNGTMTMNNTGSFDTHGFIWYAQGVGTVKSGLDGTYTSELTAYNIP